MARERGADGTQPSSIADLVARLDRVESELAIRRLAADYAHGADKRQIDRFLSVWHDDGVWVAGDEFSGHDAIRQAVERQWDGFAQMHHLNGNHVIDITGDSATGESDVLVSVEIEPGRWVRSGGTYVDMYERRAGVWKISRREATTGFTLDQLPDWIRA